MGGGVIAGGDLIVPFGDDLAILDDHGPKGTTLAGSHHFVAELDRPAHEIFPAHAEASLAGFVWAA
jgi:hypothetical protein